MQRTQQLEIQRLADLETQRAAIQRAHDDRLTQARAIQTSWHARAAKTIGVQRTASEHTLIARDACDTRAAFVAQRQTDVLEILVVQRLESTVRPALPIAQRQAYLTLSHVADHMGSKATAQLACDPERLSSYAGFKNAGATLVKQDLRFFVNVLEHVNWGRGAGIFKPSAMQDRTDPQAWKTTRATAGEYIWVPGLNHALSLVGVVPGGHLTGAALEGLKSAAGAVGEFALGGAAFTASLFHGIGSALFDMVKAILDLVWGAIKGIITGSLMDDLAGFFNAIVSAASNIPEIAGAVFGDVKTKLDNAANLMTGTPGQPALAGALSGGGSLTVAPRAAASLTGTGRTAVAATSAAARETFWTNRLKMLESIYGKFSNWPSIKASFLGKVAFNPRALQNSRPTTLAKEP